MPVGESLRSQLFINSEKVGDFVEITLPVTGEDEEAEIARIHYLEAGVGEPLLLIHSLGQSLYTWRNVFAELSDNYRVIAIDLPGHGYSSRPDTFAYTADDFAYILNGFLDALNIKSSHMVSFSIGAIVYASVSFALSKAGCKLRRYIAGRNHRAHAEVDSQHAKTADRNLCAKPVYRKRCTKAAAGMRERSCFD